MLLNISNHSANKWSGKQIAAASAFGKVIDFGFPQVRPDGDEEYIRKLALQMAQQVEEVFAKESCSEQKVVHLMGEMSLTVALLHQLQAKGYICIASTSERIIEEREDGTKLTKFEFERFRAYEK